MFPKSSDFVEALKGKDFYIKEIKCRVDSPDFLSAENENLFDIFFMKVRMTFGRETLKSLVKNENIRKCLASIENWNGGAKNEIGVLTYENKYFTCFFLSIIDKVKNGFYEVSQLVKMFLEVVWKENDFDDNKSDLLALGVVFTGNTTVLYSDPTDLNLAFMCLKYCLQKNIITFERYMDILKQLPFHNKRNKNFSILGDQALIFLKDFGKKEEIKILEEEIKKSDPKNVSETLDMKEKLKEKMLQLQKDEEKEIEEMEKKTKEIKEKYKKLKTDLMEKIFE